jgi:hypothetical protein
LWERSNRNKAADESSTSLQLVSSDTTGHIIVWDVVVGNPRAVLQEGNKPVLGKECMRIKNVAFIEWPW